MATDGRNAATRGVKIDAMLEARMKMETQGSADSESGKDAGKASCIIRSERLKESWEEVTPENIKQEPEAGLHEHWEAQQHKTVRSPQSRWEDALSPGLAPGGDSPGEGASNIRQLFPGEETELLSGISGDTRHPVNNLLVKYQVDCQKVKEETLAERDANWDLERQCFRQFCYQDVEGPREVCGMLRKLCYRWLQPEGNTKEQILEMVILEQFMNVLPSEMQSWVWEGCPETCFQAVALAENFLRRQQKLEAGEQQEEVADFPETEGAPSDSCESPLFQEIEEDGGATTMGDERAFWKESNQRENSTELGFQWMLPGQREHNFPHYSDLGEASENHQETLPDEGKVVYFQQSFEHLNEIPEIQQRILQGEICTECGKSFQSKAELTKHQCTHSGEKPYMCLECGKSFSQQSHLMAHELTHSQEKPFSCPDCGQSFTRKTGLVAHQTVHTGERPFNCLECGKNFRQRLDLIRHQKIHTGEKPHECPDCLKSFRKKSAFLVHQRIHTEEKPYPCSTCGKSFRHRTNLIAHERIHTGEKPYKCTECEKSFSDRSSLMKHKRSHTGEKPYKCLQCGKSYSQNAGLLQHEKIHTGEKPFECPECLKSFRDKSAFISHRRTHTNERPFHCSGCDKSFSHRSNLLKHERTHTGEKPFQCLECGKSYTRKPNLLLHERTHAKEKVSN